MQDLIGSLTTAVDIVKKLREMSEKVKDVELKNYIADLFNELGDLKLAIADLKEENGKLREQNMELKNIQGVGEELIRDGNCYYKKSDHSKSQPFCMPCFDYDKRLVNLIIRENSFGHVILCNICEGRKAK